MTKRVLILFLMLTAAAGAQVLALQQGAKLVGAMGTAFAKQGYAVAVSGDGNTAVVGAPYDSNGSTSAGAIFIFVRSAGVWQEQAHTWIGWTNTYFGSSVAISYDGNTVAVGTPGYGTAGTVLVFLRTGTTWASQGTWMVGSGATGAAAQGTSVALSGDGNTLLVGGPGDNSAGAVWVWTRSGTTWTQQGNKLTGSAGAFGTSVALSADGNTALVGVPYSTGGGAVSVWTRSGTTWTQQASALTGSGGSSDAKQGWSVALSADGNTAFEGGQFDNSQVGAAWVWTRSGSAWTQQGNKLVGTGAGGNGNQGYSVSLSGDGNTALVGSYWDNVGVGATWLWTRSGTTWTQQGNKIVGAGAVMGGGHYTQQGWSVALSSDGNTALVGCNSDNSGVGAAWAFRLARPFVQQGAKLAGTTSSAFGISLAISTDGQTAVIGADGLSSGAGGAWIYTRSGNTWVVQGGVLSGSGAIGNANQGVTTAISADGSTVLVGGWRDSSNSGAVWVWTRSGTTWSQQAKLSGFSGAFGSSVALSADGNTALVGASLDSSSVGAFYTLTRSGTTWTQQGTKHVVSGASATAYVGTSCALSADGSTALIGGSGDTTEKGAFWVWLRSGTTWAQQGSKMVSTGGASNDQQGSSVALSADGNTALIGGIGSWIWTRSGTTWTQQSGFLLGSDRAGTYPSQGLSGSALSSDGNTALTGIFSDGSGVGATWVWTRSGTTWTQQGNKLVGSGGVGNQQQSFALALSGDGTTLLDGGFTDNSQAGAVWAFAAGYVAPPSNTRRVILVN
jgi:hypothetical protein